MALERIVQPLARVLNEDYKELQVKFLSEKLYYLLKNQDYAQEALEIAQRRLEKEGKGTQRVLSREAIIQKIRGYFKENPVEKAWLFGSFAHNEPRYDSDLDILVRFKQPNQLDIFDYITLVQDLEEISGRKVDLVEEGFLLTHVQENVEREKVLIYGEE
ncbi:MAG: hypothetical protein HC880_18610 [Bacteroidia bacterium]|nr:hypothetical protein [Bacteroidia bacterium]